MLCQTMRLYNVEWDGKVIQQWILQRNTLSKSDHIFCSHYITILINTGGELGWHFTCFRFCYLCNTREILSPCCVSFNQRWRIPSHCSKWVCMREALVCDNEQIADKCYTECGTTRSGCCGGRWRLAGSRGGASAHAPSTRENLVTNFSYEDLTSASSGCEALWKHTISNTQTHYLEWNLRMSIFSKEILIPI